MPPPVTSLSAASQLDLAVPVLTANGWLNAAQLDHLREQISTRPPPQPTGGRGALSQLLLDLRLLTHEQCMELDTILRQQALLPDFQLLRKLGAGGMGTVFLAQHRDSGRECALKTINARLAEDGDFVERFHREAKALATVRHAHIAETIASGEHDGHLFLAMEYIDGPSLMSLLKDYRALPEAYALRLIRQVADGLGHVYDTAKLVHRDIKPENILVVRKRAGGALFGADDVAKLIDFGLVKSMEGNERLTQTGMTIGTPLYMSPEQVRGESLDCRSDIYGLGTTLFHLLTGSTPFTGTSPGAIMSAHLTQPVPDPLTRVPSLHACTRRIAMTAMAKEPADRYTTYAGLIAAIDAGLTELGEQKNSTLKLLRKPMILPKSAIKPVATPPKDERSPVDLAKSLAPTEARPVPQAQAQPVTSEVTSRIMRKHANLKAAKDSKQGRTAMPASAPATVPAALNPAQALVEAQQRRLALPAATAAPPVVTSPSAPLAAQPQPSSAAFDHEASHATGSGLLPWIVLGIAVLALAGYLLTTFVFTS